MTAGPGPTGTRLPLVQWVGDQIGPDTRYRKVVTQQAGEVTLTLSRSDAHGSLQVEVTDSASSTRTVTFADGRRQAYLNVPVPSVPSNSGEFDDYLRIQPVVHGDIRTGILPVFDLKVLASDPALPPEAVTVVYRSREIVLSFNKPMDPGSASDVKNYVVRQKPSRNPAGYIGDIASLAGVIHSSFHSVPLRSARYDPATQSVTLIPEHPIHDPDLTAHVVHRQPGRASDGRNSDASHGLTDLQGNPINPDTTPGKVEINLALSGI